MRFPFYKQLNTMDCGPTCLRMVAKHYGKYYNLDTLRKLAGFNKLGVSLFNIKNASEEIGLEAKGVRLTIDDLKILKIPSILHWNQNHFVVLIKASRNSFTIADPAKGILTLTRENFLRSWSSSLDENGNEMGLALILTPSSEFYDKEGDKEKKVDWRSTIKYLNYNRKQFLQIVFTLIISSGIQLLFPYLTQKTVDFGIEYKDVSLIITILLAQLMLTFSQSILEFLQGRLLLRISNFFNFNLLSSFWTKLTKLPLSFFDSRHTGDILQRLDDHIKIRDFLTNSLLSTLFSALIFIVYSVALFLYQPLLVVIFIAGSLLNFTWMYFFLSIKRKINYESFYLQSKENDITLQFIQGMQEIRLNNAELEKGEEWEDLQVDLFKLNTRNLIYSQWQSIGGVCINQTQNLIISFIVATLVIKGELTLGTMLAIQYIIGQLNSPITQWINFIQNGQDAKISFERLNEIHHLPNEENDKEAYLYKLPICRDIVLKNMSFEYPGNFNEPVLKNISLTIPAGKTTAIVGSSGSGKTTLMKILLKVYDNYEGNIFIGDESDENNASSISFASINPTYWRRRCGAVMQDGYIFNDTILNNISIGTSDVKMSEIEQCCKLANIDGFIHSLPNGIQTLLGSEGMSLSQGQKQRLLIARALYRDPDYLFFDEATNSLDAENERQITQNLNEFIRGKTAIIIAHRLSTVKNADKIVVLKDGEIIEEGTHLALTSKKGFYYKLVRDQLELGN